MAYTDVWDVTTPLDTQAANQGAVDFRATKLDIMQRVASFGAGLLAARPTPETTGATADWTGVTYLATDTNQLFRWSGVAWVDISASTPNGSANRIFCDGVLHTMAVDVTLQTIYSGTVLGGVLGLTGGFRGRFFFDLSASGGESVTVSLTFGGSSFTVVLDSGTITIGILDFSIINQNNAGQQSLVFTKFTTNNTISVSTNTGLTIDTTVNQTLAVKAQKTRNTDFGSFLNGYAEII